MQTNIVVSMIVKNESKIIERCLNSIKKSLPNANLILSISDTGSTDGTPKIIKDWGTTNKIRTFVHKWTMFLGGHVHRMSDEGMKSRYNIDIHVSDLIDVHWYMGVRPDERLTSDQYKNHILEKELFPHLVTPIYLVSHNEKNYHMNPTELVNYFNQIPGKREFIESEHFVNFEHNRNRNLTRTKEIIELCKLDPKDTIILLCDADMMLKTDAFNLSVLDDSVAWNVIQYNNGSKYSCVRLIRADRIGSYSFKTHEYYEVDGKIGTLNESRIWYDDKSDGGSKLAKFERDEEMLLTEKECQRKYYYLGVSQKCIASRCLANSEKALLKKSKEELIRLSKVYKHKAYESLTKASTYRTYLDQTMWALLKLAEIRLTDEPIDDLEIGRKIVLYTRASYQRPDRLEPYYYLGKYFRELDSKLTTGIMSIAYNSLMKALEIITTTPQTGLFVDTTIDLNAIHYELSVVSFYVGEFIQGLKSCDRLLGTERYRPKAYSDSKFYTAKLSPIKKTSRYKSQHTLGLVTPYYDKVLSKDGVTLCRHHDNYYRIFCGTQSSLIFKLNTTKDEDIKIVRVSETCVNVFTKDESGSIQLDVY